VGVDRILVGNGSTELIHLLARAYLSPPRPGTSNVAFLLTPTYGEYKGACQLAGASVLSLDARRCNGFSWDLEEACCRIAAQRPSLVFLCNPNNPTGVYLPQRDVESLVEATAAAGGLLVVDEAYISFVDHPWDSLALLERDSVVLLRSMTKDYALTSLRLGYSLATEEVTRRLASFQPDWSVNGLAQAAGLVALADTDYLPRARKTVAEAKEYLTAQLTSLGFTVLPSAANFLLVQVGDGAAWREKLMHRGLFVRDCASFGLPDCIRVGIRALPDCQRLVRAMAEAV
jgi:histidinol-phosphate aminotransferase